MSSQTKFSGHSDNSAMPLTKRDLWFRNGQPCDTKQDEDFCKERLRQLMEPINTFGRNSNIPEGLLTDVSQYMISKYYVQREQLKDMQIGENSLRADHNAIRYEITPVFQEAESFLRGALCPGGQAGEPPHICTAQSTALEAGDLQYKMAMRGRTGLSGYGWHMQKLGVYDQETRDAIPDRAESFMNYQTSEWRAHGEPTQGEEMVAIHTNNPTLPDSILNASFPSLYSPCTHDQAMTSAPEDGQIANSLGPFDSRGHNCDPETFSAPAATDSDDGHSQDSDDFAHTPLDLSYKRIRALRERQV